MPEDVLDQLSKAIGRKVEPAKQPAKNAPNADLEKVGQRFPAYKKYLSNVVIKPGKNQKGDDRQVEFYPPWESQNPNPGKLTVQPYRSDSMSGEGLTNTVSGELLHYIGGVDPSTGIPVDPNYHALKQKVANARTPEQKALDERIYEEQKKRGEKRPFDQWFNQSRLDEYIMGYVTPDKDDEWRKHGFYSHPEMAKAVEDVKSYLTKDQNASASLEQIIGRPVITAKISPLAKSRFQFYSEARKNGFDPDKAVKAAMSTAGVMTQAPPETFIQKLKKGISSIPVGGGRTAGSALDDFGRMFGSAKEKFFTPGALTEKEWEERKKSQQEFFERHIGKNLAGGAATGAAEFGEEFLSPFQIALLVGTMGESALVRTAAKIGVKGAIPAAKTVSKLIQLQFASQMVEGAATGLENFFKSVIHGDWENAGKSAVEGLASGLMAKGLISHEQAIQRIRGDLEKTAREQFGVPEGGPIKGAITSRFDQLDPYRQGMVIDEAVKKSPEYQDILKTADQQNEQAKTRTKKQRERKLNDYYGRALEQSWQPNVAKRTIRNLQRGRERGAAMAAEDARKQSIADVIKTIRTAAERRAKAINEEYERKRQEGIEERPERRQAVAEARTERSKVAEEIASQRDKIFQQRNESQKITTEEVPARQVEAVADAEGNVTYPAHYWGEENNFGVSSDVEGHAIYRQTPRGVEWLDASGNFSEEPQNLFFSHDPATADTIARLSSVSANADSLADAEGATREQKEDAEKVAEIRRQLVTGEIDAKEAQRQAGIAEKGVLPDEFTAARDGRLNGPFHEYSRAGYVEALEKEAREAGVPEEDSLHILDNAGLMALQQTENNLHHVYRPGDYIISKRGVKWTLDSNGMLHPNDGGQPIPLMKSGMYSNQALQMASSGRIGYGTLTREDRRLEAARRRSIEAEIRARQEEVDKEMRLAVQREGLKSATEFESRADIEGKMKREMRRLTRPPEQTSKEEQFKDEDPLSSSLAEIGRLIYAAPSDPKGVIRSIADAKGVPVEEVMRLAVANDPERSNTPEAQIARLEVGDEISDDFRKDRPWRVEQAENRLVLRSGNANPIPLDRLNPSDRVRQIVSRGTVTSQRAEFSGEDISRIAYEKPHYFSHQEDLTQQVQDRMEGKSQDPEPRNEEQAIAQSEAANRRSSAAESVATRSVVEAMEPKAETVEKAEEQVAKAEEQVKIAEEAYAQAVEAKVRTQPQEVFLQKAPVSIGIRGTAGKIVQNNREIPFHYELLPLESLVTSHVWQGNKLVENEDYPQELQPRTISENESLQNVYRAERQNYDFRQYADKTISGQMGPAIVEEGGRVVGGNTRIALLRKHIQNLDSIANPEEKQAALDGFRAAMRKAAFDAGMVDIPNDGKQYVVVRMMDTPIDNGRQAAELGRLFNKPVGVQITKAARGVSFSKAFTPALLEDISRRVEAHDGIAAAVKADPQFFRDIVTNQFGIDPVEYADWFTDDAEKGLVLHDQGRDQLTKALLGTVIKDTSVLNRIEGKTPYRALERSLGNIIKLRSLPDRDIVEKIEEAAHAAAETMETDPVLSRAKDKWSATYHPDQQGLPGMELQLPPEPDRVVEALWRALHASDAAVPRVFNDRLKAFIGEQTSKGGHLFDEVVQTPSEAFNKAFSKELRDVQLSRGDKRLGVAQEEFEQSLKNREMSDQEREESWKKQDGKQVEDKKAEENIKPVSPTKIMEPPPKPPKIETDAERKIGVAKTEQGYVTPQQLREFLQEHPATRDHSPELMRTAQMMAEYVYDADPPVGVDRKQALEWVLRERLAGIEKGELKGKRGQYSDPNIEKQFGDRILKLHQAADASTFIHEFAHVIFPMLSDEDLKAIDTIRGPKERGTGLSSLPSWDGNRKNLTKDVYAGLSEKFSHGLEQFLRDENPTGFTSEVKAVLAKVKEIMRKVYMQFVGDPLSEFKNTEESREVFSKMFGITDFDVADRWREEVKKARAEENKMKMPEDTPHPIAKLASDTKAIGIAKAMEGRVEDSVGDRVDPKKPVVVLRYPGIEDAVAAWATAGEEGSKIQNAELIQAPDGTWGIKFNTKAPVPSSVLYQLLPDKHPGVRLQELEEAKRKTTNITLRKALDMQIENLKNEIRSKHGVEPSQPKKEPEVAAKALEEIKNAKATERIRTGANAVPGFPKPGAIGGIPKPPKLGMSGYAGAEQRGGTSGRPVAGVGKSLSEVRPVTLEPIAERGTPVGTIKGEPFNEKAWRDSLKKAGLPENAPPPTWALDRKTADKLIYPGQKPIVQLALSALEHGDGFVIATNPGTGKTFTSMATVKEFRTANPDAKILVITKNTGLLKSAQGVAENTFGFDVEREIPQTVSPGVYGTTYQRIIRNDSFKNTKWDLVVADESGEARNWFQDQNKQGKALKDIIENSGKALYLSATPFHSPQEYGYLDKLNLWPKGQFDKWIENNFAHEKIGDKVVARLDPSKQAKLRQQLVERGQLVSQAISYDGFTAHFGVVPVTDEMKRSLNRIREGFSRAKSQLMQIGKKGLAEKASAFEATYTKAFLERERIPQAIELAKKARAQGWNVMIFSETSSEDLFRRKRMEGVDPSTYQLLDDAMGGSLSRIIPPFENVYDRLKEEFGDDIADYSGRGNTMGERDKAKADFLSGKTPMLYTTYAAGGIGVSLHDADYPEMGIKGGDKPRVAIFLGPPYSGVLLEQAMGRPWRFGVKSDVHAVFLATDSEPDVRLMQQKVGPRMRALRAAVLGEKDSLASAMSSYTDEEKVRARQDALAYAEGDEIKVNANSFQVRTKTRDVGINDWSAINFPSAETAKNKGMKYGEEVPGGDWSTLYQSKFGMYEPPSPKDEAGLNTVDAIGNGIADGDGLPEGVSVQNLDPADRDVVTGASTAAASEEVDIPVDRDKEAVARQSMQAQLNMPGDKNKWVLTYPKGKSKGVWKYTGNPEDLSPVTPSGVPDAPHDIKTFYLGNIFTQEIGIKAIARKAKASEAGDAIVRMNRSYQADRDIKFSEFSQLANDIMHRNKIDPNNNKAIGEIWDVVEGKWSSGDPNIQKAAEEMASLMETINDELASADVKIKTPNGTFVPFSKMTRDRRYMPHRIDWKAKVEDPLTGETHTLKEIMGKTFAEDKRNRIIQALAQQSGSTYTEVMDYLSQYSPSTPVLSHIHRARVMNFPIIKKDWPTLVGYFDQAAEAIAIEKNFGSDRTKLNKEIDKIPSFNGRKTIRSMFDSLLEPADWQNSASKFYNSMIGFEVLSKMTLSAAKVPYHLVHVPLALGGRVTPTIKAFARTLVNPKAAMENATYVGTVARQLNVADLIGQGAEKGLAHEVFKKTLFQAFYRWGRVIAGESARVWMEQYAMNDLRKGGRSEVEARRMLRDTMLIGDKAIDDAKQTGRWSPEDLGKAQTAFANYTMFSDNSIQMPGWARLGVHPDTPSPQVALYRALRLTYALQSFSLKTTSILREKLWDEVMIHHNYKPLAYFIAAYPIVGEMLRGTGAGVKGLIQLSVSGAQAKLTGQGQKKEDAWDKYFETLKDDFGHGPVGILKRIIDNITFGIAWDRTRRLADPLLNLSEGKGKQARPEFMYSFNDEVEQDVGAAWSTLVLKPMELAAQEGIIASGTKGPASTRHEKEEKKLIQFLLDEFPVTKQWPALQEWLHKKPQSQTRQHFY